MPPASEVSAASRATRATVKRSAGNAAGRQVRAVPAKPKTPVVKDAKVFSQKKKTTGGKKFVPRVARPDPDVKQCRRDWHCMRASCLAESDGGVPWARYHLEFNDDGTVTKIPTGDACGRCYGTYTAVFEPLG